MFKAIAFDLDGTLINTEPFYRRVMALVVKQEFDYDLTKEEYDQHYFGKTTRQGVSDVMNVIWGHPPTTAEVEAIVIKVIEQASKLRQSVSASIFPGAVELLDWCRSHQVPTAVVTNASRRAVETNRDWYRWDELIARADNFVSYSDVGEPKPAPDVYLKAAELLGVAPGELLVVEDTLQGIASGKAAGATTALVNGPMRTGADYHFATIRELSKQLPSLF